MYKTTYLVNIIYEWSGLLKSVGITRKIDELGRIVIPKEIRNNLCIREGESIEIITDNDNIILKKYLQLSRYSDISKRLVKIVSEVYGIDVIITDRDKVIACSDNIDIVDNNIGNDLISLIDNRELFEGLKDIYFNNNLLSGYYYIKPIIVDSDSIGLIIIRGNNIDFKLIDLMIRLIVM